MPNETNNTGRSAAVLASTIRSEIFRGSFAPGSALREISLAERFGVSRRTVREALLTLAADGLVTHRHNQGASVRIFDADDVRDIYRSRRILEIEGARQVPHAPEHLLNNIEVALQGIVDAAETGLTSVELAEADSHFHGSVIALLQSPRLEQFYSSIAHQMVRAITLLQESDASAKRDLYAVIAEHQAINDALQHREAWEAQRLIIEHIDRHERNLLHGLQR